MSLHKRLNCLLGKHERSGRKAKRYADNNVRSICKNCGTPMFRHPREGWMVERRRQQRCFEPAGPEGGEEALGPDVIRFADLE